jgi:hypothetical protein
MSKAKKVRAVHTEIRDVKKEREAFGKRMKKMGVELTLNGRDFFSKEARKEFEAILDRIAPKMEESE